MVGALGGADGMEGSGAIRSRVLMFARLMVNVSAELRGVLARGVLASAPIAVAHFFARPDPLFCQERQLLYPHVSKNG